MYSVPNQLVGSQVEVRATVTTVEILHRSRRVASHARSYGPKGTEMTVTDPSHRPRSHQEYGDWPPSRVIGWGENLGPHVADVVRKILESKPHPEMGYRSCMALLRDVKRYDAGRVDAACRRALEIGAPNRHSVVAILRRGLESVAVEPPPTRPMTTPNHNPDPEPAADPGALLLSTPPPPPPPATIRVTIPHGCAWTARDVPGATQVDVMLTPSPRPRPRPQGGRRL